MSSTLIQGTFVCTPTIGSLQILSDHLIAVSSTTGLITHFAPITSSSSIELLQSSPSPPIVLPPGTFLLPNFCDLHIHAPQFLYQGTGLHLPLMQWLDEYAYKAEERLDADAGLARRVYTRLATRLVEKGTGTVLLFGTIKEETNLILAEIMQKAGLRAFVGKLSMDISSRPTYTEPSAAASLYSASSFITQCQHLTSSLPLHRRLVAPVLTPRFVPTCSDELLSGLAALSVSQSLVIQSHMSESRDEVTWVRDLRGAEDIEVFEKHGLLTPRTIQAHCTFLSIPNLTHLSTLGTAVAHCPLSNAYFSDKPFPLREALIQGVKVGLGTDVAGGYDLDIMSSMRYAVAVSRMREGTRALTVHADGPRVPAVGASAENLSINWQEALYLATQGGAHALGLPPGSGNFEIGTPFDAQQIQLLDPETRQGIGALDFFDLETGAEGNILLTLEMVEKWWCVGDDRNRVGMWVQGNNLFEKAR
ncbi:hypothetical protein BDZ94DRAFT_1285273 [Collybia nuda]|uniref:Amidohydrolase-related domain-containing protein n=1 Tax=Collybia nuda TaxID=64659 RepID=A0A9P6CCT2_9AGAR|nr:hypothetical protein BDZ94DRAFT_1285273 [Collybia nuda]